MAGKRGIKKAKEPKGPKYALAPEVQELAVKLINDHHTHLCEARMKYLFRNGKWSTKSKSVLGRAKKTADDVRFLGEYDFCIIINAEAWNNADSKTREALVDHELTHCQCDYDKEGNKKWNIAPHDCEEFNCIVRRHGLWQEDLQKLMIAAKGAPHCEGPHNQVELLDEKGPRPAEQQMVQ